MADDPLRGIQLKDIPEWQQQLETVPVAGSFAKYFETTSAAGQDGTTSAAEMSSITADATGFVQSCMDVGGIVSDPIGWLVSNGLSFLIEWIQPLEDALHFVTGDGPALAAAAESFNNIGSGLEEFSRQFNDDAKKSVATWGGSAAEAAGARFGEFANGIIGTAGECGNIARLLQISSMVMKVIEDFIKAIISELITWLIMIWIPALASAVVSFGASTAAAATATAGRAAMSFARATKQVKRLERLLDGIRKLLDLLKQVFAKMRPMLTRMSQLAKTSINQRPNTFRDFASGMKATVVDTAEEQVRKPDKVTGLAEDSRKAGEYTATGEDRSVSDIERQLNF